MRVAGLAILLALVSAPLLFACGAPQPTPKPQSLIPAVFVYDEGWTIPGLDGASVIRRYQDESGSDVVAYRPAASTEVALQGFEVSTDGKSIRFIPGYVQMVDSIREYRVQGRTYAYDVGTVSLRKAEPPMWQHVVLTQSPQGIPAGVLGCGFTTLRYFDADGDGVFESLEYVGFGAPSTSLTRCPTTPEWALKLLPNRAAAERCAKQTREQRLDKLEIPPELKNVFNYQPAMPVLSLPKK